MLVPIVLVYDTYSINKMDGQVLCVTDPANTTGISLTLWQASLGQYTVCITDHTCHSADNEINIYTQPGDVITPGGLSHYQIAQDCKTSCFYSDGIGKFYERLY